MAMSQKNALTLTKEQYYRIKQFDKCSVRRKNIGLSNNVQVNALDYHGSIVGRDVLARDIGFYGQVCKWGYHTK